MATMDSAQGLARTLSSMFQSGGVNLFNNDRLRPEVLVDELRDKLLRGYNGVQHAVSRHISPTASGTATLEAPDLESQHDSHQQVTELGQGSTVKPLHPLYNIDNPFASEADASEIEDGQPAIHEGKESCKEPLISSRRTHMWMATIIIVVLSLIIVPGIVVGVTTGKMSWGVELSGAIAPIVSLLAGLYYHHNK